MSHRLKPPEIRRHILARFRLSIYPLVTTRDRAPGDAAPPLASPARRFSAGAFFRRPSTWIVLVLTTLSFLQMPGKTTFDTKLDLAVDPLSFLGRALHLWNPQATSGELQDQAYGYLFPMGPFFSLTQLFGVPMWLAQRAWCALLLCGAYLGLLLLARALDLGTEPTRQVAALAYAMAPRMLTEVGSL